MTSLIAYPRIHSSGPMMPRINVAELACKFLKGSVTEICMPTVMFLTSPHSYLTEILPVGMVASPMVKDFRSCDDIHGSNR